MWRYFLLFVVPLSLHSFEEENRLLKDLMIVNYWDCYLSQRVPVSYNHFLQGGYINMPSARMGCEGELAAGYAHVPPYNVWSLRAQLTNWLEVTGNYRVFIGVEDPLLTSYGFGDFSDKGANLKISLISPDDSDYRLPGFAIGLDDFLGTKAFNGEYIVLTKVHRNFDFEWSVGYGMDRMDGFFGGAKWMPFLRSRFCYLKPFSLIAEYDGTRYETDPHPKGRTQKTPFNVGINYRLFDLIDLSVSYIRGQKVAAAISGSYNFGYTKGILPKFDDRVPYRAPVNTERLGLLRPPVMMAQDFVYALREQGFDLFHASLGCDECGNKLLRLEVYNNKYWLEREVRLRLNNLLAYLTPMDIDKVIVVQVSVGFPIQEYHYPMAYVRMHSAECLQNAGIDALVTVKNVRCNSCCCTEEIFSKRREWVNFEVLPKTRSVFGSSTGKFKYALGLNVAFNGFLPGEIYYSLVLGNIFFTDLDGVKSIDKLNPSQLINVQTQVIDYYKQKGLTFDELYLQKNSNHGKGWFSRIALGYFEQMYAGAAAEALYYPVSPSNFAIGAEGALLKRRTTTGLGLLGTIRKLDGFEEEEVPFTGSQYFLNFYYTFQDLNIETKVMAGKFLANDFGARFELSRYFPSGLRMTIWYTYTNGNDRVNGKQYFDKGIALSMPMDIFYTHSDRERWYYGMSAWLRDVGYAAYTGDKLYDLINDQRQW